MKFLSSVLFNIRCILWLIERLCKYGSRPKLVTQNYYFLWKKTNIKSKLDTSSVDDLCNPVCVGENKFWNDN